MDTNNLYHRDTFRSVKIIEDPSMDPTVATWSGEVRREQMVLLGVLFFLSLENVRDANELFRMFKKVISLFSC